MHPLLKALVMNIPSFRDHMKRVNDLSADRDRLATRLADLLCERDELVRRVNLVTTTTPARAREEYAETKRRKQALIQDYLDNPNGNRLTLAVDAMNNFAEESVGAWIKYQVEAEPYWFHKMEVMPGLFSAGTSDPLVEKLPYYGLPADLTGKRVLDIGCAEGFFSFEAERRGAREVIGIDSFPDSIRRFNIVKTARQSRAMAYLMNVYDLEPKRLGTFDVVLFYGVFYHLKHPQYALERILSVCTGELLFQTHMLEEPTLKGIPWARFYPHGLLSGKNDESFDVTVFWLFNSAACLAMLDTVGFIDLQILSTDPGPFVVSARSPRKAAGCPPLQAEAPWC